MTNLLVFLVLLGAYVAYVVQRQPRDRPAWNFVDTWPIWILTLLALNTLATNSDGGVDETELAAAALFIGIAIQQSLQFGWPVLVSKMLGRSTTTDWRFTVDWKRDPGVGLLLAFAAVILSVATSDAVAAAVGLSADEDASNTSIISDNEGSPWLIGIILLVVIGAPLSEELLFRGLALRVLEKDLGIIVGVIGSTVLFTLPHIQSGATGGETAVLLSGLFVVGLLWGAATAHFGRLGPAIFSHIFFNGFGTLFTIL